MRPFLEAGVSIKFFLIVGFSIAMSSCGQSGRTNSNVPETLGPNPNTDETALDSAWRLAREHKHEKNFDHTFELAAEGGGKIKTRLMIGEFFANRKYLIIKREVPAHAGRATAVHFINIYYYAAGEDNFRSLIQNVEDLENYVSDTIQDINGDGRKDFIANYRTTMQGITSRYTMVNLAINDSTFTGSSFDGLQFTNPSFSLDEKTIRGVLHGESGRTEIYKYRWNGLQVDTVEFIYHDSEVPGKFIKSKYFPYDKRNTKEHQVKLPSVPVEYASLPELDWFMGTDLKEQ